MAIFKYKKPNGSGGYSIEEMPVISNTYTEYIITEDISQDPQIILKPSQTFYNINEQKTFNKVTASIDLLSTTPTYEYNINDRNKTITFNSTEWKTTMGYGDRFPPGIKISIPSSIWLNKNTDSSGDLDVELTPATTSSSVTTGYYTGGTISVKTITTNPAYTPSTSPQNITYTSTTGFPKGITINAIPTTTLTLQDNDTTYNIGSGSWAAGTYPTSITVQVPSDLPDPTNPPDNTIITAQGDSISINAGYYTEGFSITASFPENTTSGSQYLRPSTQASYPISAGYYSNGFTVYPYTQTLTITDPVLTRANSSSTYYKLEYTPASSGNGATNSWGNTYLTKVTLQISASLASNIVSGTSICGIAGTHTCPTTTLANISSDQEATAAMILSGYKAYNDQGSLITGTLSNSNVGITEILYPNFFTLSNGRYNYKIFNNTPQYIKNFSIAVENNQSVITANGAYYLFGTNASWTSIPTSINVNVSEVIASNSIGDYNSISWKIYRDGTLVVDGSGAIPDYTYNNLTEEVNSPWYNYRSQITSILIGDGIYGIGNYAFSYLENVTRISLSNSVHNINFCAFWKTGVASLLTIKIPASVYSIENGAFGYPSASILELRFMGDVPAGYVGSSAFYGNIMLFNVPWAETVKTTTSMCGGSGTTITKSKYNYNVQTDDEHYM